MNKGLGIAAFVLLLISFPIPIFGNYLSILALLLAALAALSGEQTWAVVVGIVGGIKLFWLSPSWWFLMHSARVNEGLANYSDTVMRGSGAFGHAAAAQQQDSNTGFFYFTLVVSLLPIAIVVIRSLRKRQV